MASKATKVHDAEGDAAPAPDLSVVEYPIGIFVGPGATATWIGEHEYVVDPETGYITARA